MQTFKPEGLMNFYSKIWDGFVLTQENDSS